MKYRAIRPIEGKIKLMPGEFVPDGTPKSWITKKLKAGEIAAKKEVKWQQEEQSEST